MPCYGYFHPFLIVVLTIVCTINYGVLRPQIDSLLTQLQSTSMDVALYWNLVASSVTATPDQAGPRCNSSIRQQFQVVVLTQSAA